MSQLPHKYLVSLPVVSAKALSMALVVYLMLFGYNVLTRNHDFRDPDTMNFVDVARNIVAGRGIAQSTVGFNQPHFSVDEQIPMPLTSQPPLYPLLIALFSRLGAPYAETGLLISIACYALILFLAYQLSLKLYEKRVALLAVSFLLLYAPLYSVARTTYSEPVGMTFVLLSLWMCSQVGRTATSRARVPAVAGLATGLAFASRYALLPLSAVGVAFILLESRRKLRDVTLFAMGFAAPAAFVWAHNLIVSGAIMPTPNPSTRGFRHNVRNMVTTISGEYTDFLPREIQAWALGLSLLALGAVIIVQHRGLAVLQAVFIQKRRYLLILWTVGYLAFLILQRTRTHFDPINWRLTISAGVVLVVLYAALLVKTTEIKIEHLRVFALAIVLLMIGREVWITVGTPSKGPVQYTASSERLNWVAQHTGAEDLVMGDNTVDIAFYLSRPVVLSFSPYPYTDYPEYGKVMAICHKYRNEYAHFYLVLRNRYTREVDWLVAYGSFITDIVFGRLDDYPGIIFRRRLSDGYVYEVEC